MADASYEFESLSNRDGFNRSLRHFKTVNEIVEEFEEQENLADLLNDYLSEKEISPEQVVPILNALLVDRYGYRARTHNMGSTQAEFKPIVDATSKWKGVDVVLCYFHTELGPTPLNPKNKDHWAGLETLKSHELVTIFAGAFQQEQTEDVLDKALDLTVSLLEGKTVGKPPAGLLKGAFKRRAQPAAVPAPVAPGPSAGASALLKSAAPAGAAMAGKDFSYPKQDTGISGDSSGASNGAPTGGPAATAPSAKKKMTPMYSIPVTNELFHNGNVEAWKKVIASYTAKYEGNEVYIFYEGEKINDINTLFKWGKVKHGSAILIAVGGDEIKDVAKLQRYLKQGASSMFEAFLKFPPNTVLNLF
jgi:hypothetical protein